MQFVLRDSRFLENKYVSWLSGHYLLIGNTECSSSNNNKKMERTLFSGCNLGFFLFAYYYIYSTICFYCLATCRVFSCDSQYNFTKIPNDEEKKYDLATDMGCRIWQDHLILYRSTPAAALTYLIRIFSKKCSCGPVNTNSIKTFYFWKTAI